MARAIPSANRIEDSRTREVCTAVREAVQILQRQLGNINDSAVLVSDLSDIGIIGVDGSTIYDPSAVSAAEAASTTEAALNTVILNLNASAGLGQASYNLGLAIPGSAYIVRTWYEVIVTFESVTDAATIALEVESDGADEIIAAIAISDGTNPWDAGLHEGLQDGAVANFTTKTTASRNIQATIAGGEDLTAGELNLYIESVISS